MVFRHLREWFIRYFSDPQVTALLLILLAIIITLEVMGAVLTPVIASIVIAYVLDEMVQQLERLKMPHLLAVTLVCLVSLGIILLVLLLLLPLLWQQLIDFFNEFPNMIGQAQSVLEGFVQKHPAFISSQQLQRLLADLQTELTRVGKFIISYTLTSIPSLIEIVVYAVLIPLLTFFFLKDKTRILRWCSYFMPKHRSMIQEVWHEVDGQIANYIRGRIIEIFLVGAVTATAFKLMALKYSILLGSLVGVAVIVPYIGEVVVAIPVILIAFLQWHFSAHFLYFLLIYGIIITVESNILVPLLFSETLNLHPVAIIIAILVFGGLWGFWGVFFAIPLAAVVKAIIEVWPTTETHEVNA